MRKKEKIVISYIIYNLFLVTFFGSQKMQYSSIYSLIYLYIFRLDMLVKGLERRLPCHFTNNARYADQLHRSITRLFISNHRCVGRDVISDPRIFVFTIMDIKNVQEISRDTNIYKRCTFCDSVICMGKIYDVTPTRCGKRNDSCILRHSDSRDRRRRFFAPRKL